MHNYHDGLTRCVGDERKPVHPSVFIQEEMCARGWDVGELAVRMAIREIQINQLALELYFASEGSRLEGRCRLGGMIEGLAAAFDVPREFFENLENVFLSVKG